MIRIEAFKGSAINPYVQKLAELRVREFYNFPYLYVGTIEEDAHYSQRYAEDEKALLVVAFENNQVIGLYSGIPFNSNMSFLHEWEEQALQQDFELEGYYYLGELIVEKTWRNKRIGSQIIEMFFEEINQLGYKKMAGVTAIRPRNHPLRPEGYQDTDEVWPKFGLHKTNVTLSVNYPTRQADGSVKDETNEMALWVKELSGI